MGLHHVFVCVCEREICKFKVVWYDLENARISFSGKQGIPCKLKSNVLDFESDKMSLFAGSEVN